MATVAIRSSDCHMLVRLPGGGPDSRAAICLGCNLAVSLSSVQEQNLAVPDESTVDVLLPSFEFQLSPDKITIGLHGLSVNLGHSSPEHVIATGVALNGTATQLSHIYKRWKEASSTFNQRLLYGILLVSAEKQIVDPYSTTQPSYLIQSGRPNKLRTDPILVLLHYLRRCLLHMTALERGDLHSKGRMDPSALVDSLLPLLESRLTSLALDADASGVSNRDALAPLLPSLKPGADEATSRSFQFNSGSITTGQVDLTIRDPEDKAPSRFYITSLSLDGRMRRLKVSPSSSPATTLLSQTSLKVHNSYHVRRICVDVGIGEVNLTILPPVMAFAQQILRVRRRYGASNLQHRGRGPEDSTAPIHASQDGMYFVATCTMQLLRVEAAAQNLICVFGLSNLQLASTVLEKPSARSTDSLASDLSMNHSIIFDQLYVRARTNVDVIRRTDSDILASLLLRGGKANAAVHLEPSSMHTLRTTLILDRVQLDVPRSAIRLYRFIEEWRADFLPGIEATLHGLLSEIENTKVDSPTPRPQQGGQLMLHLHAHVASVGVSLQVMHGTWLSWEVSQIVAYIRPSSGSQRNTSKSFGLQVASQVFSVSNKPYPSRKIKAGSDVKLELPMISLTGRYSKSTVYTIACVEFFQLTVKPSHWDTLLAVQQKFGQDFNDLMNLIAQTRQQSNSSTRKATVTKPTLQYVGHLKMRGFSVGLEGITSTLYLECEDIGGGINSSNGLTWDIRLSDVALSLAPNARHAPRGSIFNRNIRSAFVIIDLQAEANPDTKQSAAGQSLRFTVTKIHAVMQPSSIGEIGDFIDHLQVTELFAVGSPEILR